MARAERADSLVAKYIKSLAKNSFVFVKGNLKELQPNKKFNAIIESQEVNKFQKISRRLRLVNKHLKMNGIFIGSVQTNQQMRASKFINKIPVIRSVYRVIDFVFHRVFPKVSGLKNIYYVLTKGKNRRLTKAEVLGRLVCHGFEILEIADNIDGKLHFVVKKVQEIQVSVKSSYGPLYKMPRIGKDGQVINVFKFRTMHPYSEHLQDYVLKQNGYASTGKPANDFRLTSWGKFLRKYWIDEIPQLINVFKGDMKLVGVRPVSQRYFQDIPPHIQNLRLNQKPGCIPPYVALNMKNAKEDVLFAEEVYLRFAKKTSRTNVDSSLMYLAIRNILFKGLRSA